MPLFVFRLRTGGGEKERRVATARDRYHFLETFGRFVDKFAAPVGWNAAEIPQQGVPVGRVDRR